MSATFSRRDLYDQVWSEPIRSVANRLGVSDVWLKKCCAKADIPVPPRGYWAKFHAGKSVARAKLPLRAPGQPDSVQIGQDTELAAIIGRLREHVDREETRLVHERWDQQKRETEERRLALEQSFLAG